MLGGIECVSEKNFTLGGGLVAVGRTASRSPPVEQIYSQTAEKSQKKQKKQGRLNRRKSEIVKSIDESSGSIRSIESSRCRWEKNATCRSVYNESKARLSIT